MDSKADTDSEHASTTAAAASTGKASVDSLSQRFSLFNTTTTNTSTSAANTSKPSKGPLGLSTLHEPQGTVVADLIFVHGLGGGSHNTWRAHGDSALYWPEWLPTEEDFRDVRIHSFGYNSNWDKESILGIHDFARSLLGSIVDSPSISPRDHVGEPLTSETILPHAHSSQETLFRPPFFSWPIAWAVWSSSVYIHWLDPTQSTNHWLPGSWPCSFLPHRIKARTWPKL